MILFPLKVAKKSVLNPEIEAIFLARYCKMKWYIFLQSENHSLRIFSTIPPLKSMMIIQLMRWSRLWTIPEQRPSIIKELMTLQGKNLHKISISKESVSLQKSRLERILTVNIISDIGWFCNEDWLHVSCDKHIYSTFSNTWYINKYFLRLGKPYKLWLRQLIEI